MKFLTQNHWIDVRTVAVMYVISMNIKELILIDRLIMQLSYKFTIAGNNRIRQNKLIITLYFNYKSINRINRHIKQYPLIKILKKSNKLNINTST